MQVTFIVEGGSTVGLGHVYHSGAIADTLDQSITCEFVTKSNTEAVNKIQNLGYHVEEVDTSTAVTEAVKDQSPDVVIVDVPWPRESFFTDLRNSLAPETCLLVFGNRNKNLPDVVTSQCDIVVDFDIGSESAHRKQGCYYDETTDSWQFVGLQYLILRPEFYHRDHTLPVSDVVERVMIQFGAADPSNYTTQTVNQLLSADADYEIEVILGAGFSHEDAFNRVLATHPEAADSITVAQDVSNVAQRMTDADVVVTSPGLSMFEALLTKTSVIAIYQNDLQEIYQGYEFVHGPEQLDNINYHIQEIYARFEEMTTDLKFNMHEGRQQLIDLIEDQCQ